MKIEGRLKLSYKNVIRWGGNMSKLIEEVYNYLNMSDEERLEKAFRASQTLVGYLESIFNGDEIDKAYIQMFSIFCCVDGKFQRDEYEFFKKLTEFDISYDQFTEWMNDEYQQVDSDEFFEFAGNQNDEFKEALMVLMLCVITCDYSIHRNELQLIDEYF